MRKILTLAISLLVIQACNKRKVKVVTEEVGTHDITETVSAIGKIYPEIEVKISSDVSGEIIDIFVNEGDSIEAGQLLAKINPDLYESSLDQARASYQNAKSQQSSSAASLSRVRSSLTLAEQAYNRQKQLFEEKVISKAEMEQAENNLAAARAEYKSFKESLIAQKYTVQSAGARVDEARKNYNRTVIFAPIDGIISSKTSNKGERVVGTSQMAGTEMLRIADMSRMEVRVDVNENDIVRVKIGDTAIVEVDAYKDMQFKGVVTEIANSAKSLSGVGAQVSTNDVANFVVKVSIVPSSYQSLITQSRPFPFRPGMSATVDIITAKISNTVSIPSGSVALRTIKDSSNKEVSQQKEVVFVRMADGTVEQRVVKAGLQDANFVEITEGLKKGEEIVVYPYMAISKTLESGTAVEVTTRDKIFVK